MKKYTKVKPQAIQVILWAIVIAVIVDALAKFNIIDVTNIVSPVLIPFTASLFILMEIGVMEMLTSRRKLTLLHTFGLIIAIAGLISVIATLFSLSIPIISPFQGIINLALGLFAVLEIFR